MLIPKQVFKVSKLAARETSRCAIHGVHVKRLPDGKCVAVALDGRRLIKATWDDECLRPEFPCVGLGSVDPVADFSAIVSTKQWNEAEKAIPRRGKPILLNCLLDETTANGRIQMGSTDLENPRTLGGDSLEGNFPKYQDVIPDYIVGDNAVEIGVNPLFLAEICKVVGEVATSEDSKGIRLVVPTNPNNPLVVEGRNGEGIEATAVLMPVSLGKPEKLANGRERLSKVRAATRLHWACELFVRAFNEKPEAFQTDEMRVAYSSALGVLEDTGFKLEDVDLDELAGSLESEGSAQDAPTESGVVTTHPSEENAVGDAETVQASDPEPSPEPENVPKDARVAVKRLRDNPDKWAPISGARCRSCGASAHRAKFSPKDKWLVVNGAAFCPACEDQA